MEDKTSVLICCLLPDKTESCSLDLQFQEEDKVTFSVLGPRSVHLAGYYLHAPPNNDHDRYLPFIYLFILLSPYMSYSHTYSVIPTGKTLETPRASIQLLSIPKMNMRMTLLTTLICKHSLLLLCPKIKVYSCPQHHITSLLMLSNVTNVFL